VPPFAVKVAVHLAAPGKISASCPYTIQFKGSIEASAACTVKFKFIRSDGALKPVQTLSFLGPGTKMVTDSWSLGLSLSGWEAIQVLTPVAVISNHADFKLTCMTSPRITGAHLFCGGWPTCEIDLVGTNFGATQGTKKVLVDGIVHSGTYHWGDTEITLLGGSPIIFWDHMYQFVIQDGAVVISNAYSTRFPIRFDGYTPHSGSPGTEVKISAFGGGTPADGRLVKIGAYTCPVVSWTSGALSKIIIVKVPIAPAGSYKIYIKRGADIISEQYDFSIL
jgi:hypothetical protein